MTGSVETKCAELILQLLVGQDQDSMGDVSAFGTIDWDLLLMLARENRVVIRLYERLLHKGIQPGALYQSYVQRERERIVQVSELMIRVSRVCEDAGISYVFMKNFQHYPDMGDDIDLLVLHESDIDRVIIEKLGVKPCRLSKLNQFGGKSQYYFQEDGTNLEIHHARMGRLGEHVALPQILMQNIRYVPLGGVGIPVPSEEDQIIIQIIQRVYTRFYLRISELMYGVECVCSGKLNFDYLTETTSSVGLYTGLCYYFSLVNAFYLKTTQSNLPIAVPEFLRTEEADRVEFKSPYYRLPIFPTGISLFVKKLLADVQSSNWESVARLGLAPTFAILTGIERANQRMHEAIEKGPT